MASTLTVNGRPLDLNLMSPQLVKLKGILDKSKPSALFTGPDFAARIGIKPKTLRQSGHEYSLSLPDYTTTVRNGLGHTIRYWGNPKAIAELRKQVGE